MNISTEGVSLINKDNEKVKHSRLNGIRTPIFKIIRNHDNIIWWFIIINRDDKKDYLHLIKHT